MAIVCFFFFFYVEPALTCLLSVVRLFVLNIPWIIRGKYWPSVQCQNGIYTEG